jgi:hypothetical protein
MSTPKYRSTINEVSQAGNAYTVLGDDWGRELLMPNLQQVSIDCSQATGQEAQIAFGTAAGYGGPLRVPLGITTWDRLKELSGGELDRVKVRNAVLGQNAGVIVEVWGA